MPAGWVSAKNESRRSGPGGGKMSTSRRLNRARIWFSARRTVAVEAMILGRTLLPSIDPAAQLVQGRLVEPDHGPHGAGDQVQLVLDDQIRRLQRGRERAPPVLLAGAVESVLVVAVGTTEEGPDLAGPGHGRELVDRGDQEARQAAIDRLVDGQNRQRTGCV